MAELAKVCILSVKLETAGRGRCDKMTEGSHRRVIGGPEGGGLKGHSQHGADI